jgi:hypothetical protein
MSGTRIPGPLNQATRKLREHDGTMARIDMARPGSQGAGALHPDVHDADMKELRSLGIDLLQLAYDLAGVPDPITITDAVGGLISLARGPWLKNVMTGMTMVPYVGEINANLSKCVRSLKALERALDIASRSKKCAHILDPGLERLYRVLSLFPENKSRFIDDVHARVKTYLKKRGWADPPKEVPDIGRRFKFRTYERDGKMFYKEATGRLGVPTKVKTHRSQSSQKDVSAGTGDDAGHLIGDRFGGPGTAENLSLQNWRTNRGGTFKDLENTWAQKLQDGIGIEVRVTDVTKKGENRPFMRTVEWDEIFPDGTTNHTDIDFMNPHTPESRLKQGIEPTVSEPQKDNVIPVDFQNKKRLDTEEK